MQVFPYGQYRLLFCLRHQPGDERFLGLVLLPLGTEVQREIALGMRQRQQGRQQWQRLLHGHARLLQGLFQPGEARFRWLLSVHLHQPLEVFDHRV